MASVLRLLARPGRVGLSVCGRMPAKVPSSVCATTVKLTCPVSTLSQVSVPLAQSTSSAYPLQSIQATYAVRSHAATHAHVYDNPRRFFAKKSKPDKKKQAEEEGDWEEDLDIDFLKEEMDELLAGLKEELSKLRVGRVSPSQLEDVMVDAYGDKTELKNVGQVGVRGARTLVVTLYDQSLATDVIRSLESADVEAPQYDGHANIIVNYPKPTKDVKDQMVKKAGQLGHQCKEKIKLARRGFSDNLSKYRKQMEADTWFQLKEEMDVVTKERNAKVKELVEQREKEIAADN